MMSSNSPLSSLTDVGELFDLLDSSRPSTVAEIKNLIVDNFNQTKEGWLVTGLFDFYILTNSVRCIEILSGILKEPHDRYLIEKIADGLRNPATRKQSLNLLGYVVRKQPSWLYKITQYGLLKELIRILKTETDVVVLVSGLLIVITILPIIPTYIGHYVNEIFDVFSRLATWTHTNNQELAEEQLLHLQVGLYALFHRLYGMFPCGFLSYLRRNFSAPDKTLIFHHTIRPMLETVRMHPLLVTANREVELQPQRWKSKEYHDVMAECSKLSLNINEAGDCDESSFRPRLSSVIATTDHIPSYPPLSLESSELTNLASFAEDNGAVIATPLTNTSQAAAALTLTPPNADETAMEATPENTPLQTPVKDRERLVFKMPDRASSAAVHLNFGGPSKSLSTSGNSNFPAAPSSTPANSVPTSPLPQLESLSRRDSLSGESLLARRDSVFAQRLQKMLLDHQQQGHVHPSGEHKGLQINIPPNSEPETSQEPPGGPLTPLLQPSIELLEEPPPPCHPEGSACKGGLHMPDAQSLIAFATRVKRMRFYSQCENAVGESSLKRSMSCPEITEEPEDAGQVTPVAVENTTRPFYEHLFETLTDVWGSEDESKSPQVLLDECIKKASLAHDNSKFTEQRLRAQVELLHGQLLFERHRREAHTLRNRRLANKVRKAQNCEEQNSSFKIQIHQLEKEIASLKKEISRQRTASTTKETELQGVVEDLKSKLKVSKATIDGLEVEKSELTGKIGVLNSEHDLTRKELDDKLATIFSLESNISHYQRYASENEELKKACEVAQRNILLLGELCRRQDEVLKSMGPIQFNEDVDTVKQNYEEEIKGLKHAIETTSSQYEASLAFIHDLEVTLNKKDKVIEDLKKLSEDIAAEYQIQLRAMEDKYESAKAINHRLELEILNLNSLVALKKLTGPTSPKAATSGGDSFMRNGVSPTDSDVTVDSATSAGGFGGLSSPERNQFIFGSPQFENPAEELMSDLRKAID